MTSEVKINGKALPCSFGMAALSAFLESEGMKLSDLDGFGENGLSLKTALNLVYHGIKDGHRREKKPFGLSYEDVCDLVDEEQTLIQQCIDVFVKSMPQSEGKPGNGQVLPKETAAEI